MRGTQGFLILDFGLIPRINHVAGTTWRNSW